MKIIQRFKRQSVKEGRCPSWAVIRNCSSLEQCIWDRDCSGSQKCCKSTCETRSCYEPILRIGPNEGTFTFFYRNYKPQIWAILSGRLPFSYSSIFQITYNTCPLRTTKFKNTLFGKASERCRKMVAQ